MISNRSHNELKTNSERSRHELKNSLKRTPNELKMDSKRSQNELKTNSHSKDKLGTTYKTNMQQKQIGTEKIRAL